MLLAVGSIVRLQTSMSPETCMSLSGPPFLSVWVTVFFQSTTNPMVLYAQLYFTEHWEREGGENVVTK